MRSQNCDILVIGSGIAGLSFALHCAHHFREKKVVVLSKAPLEEGNTRYAQGGIAAVMDRLHDSYEKHIEDTLRAGDGLCNVEIVDLVVKEAPQAMLKLMDWGVSFDRRGDNLALGREGGHSTNRILHCKDHIGQSISSTLLKQCRNTANIELRENQFVLQLLKDPHNSKCTGVLVSDESGSHTQQAQYTMLASGGAGQVYQLTSNPTIATGDGLALAAEAGATLQNMAFVQFHPTVLYEAGAEKPFLISEAVRGLGAILRNHKGEDFMLRYDSRGSLATRDIVARAIFHEMKQSGQPHLWLDLRHLNPGEFAMKFPNIAQRVAQLGINIQYDMVPVLPAAHYFCGGIATDKWARTSLAGLLACGEVACTGLHGANRLASNSLLEALVFAHRAFLHLKNHFSETALNVPAHTPLPEFPPAQNFREIRLKLQEIMTAKAGIVRNLKNLLEAQEEVSQMLNDLPHSGACREGNEVKNMLRVAQAVIEDSLQQNKNRGGFYREDLTPSTLLV